MGHEKPDTSGIATEAGSLKEEEKLREAALHPQSCPEDWCAIAALLWSRKRYDEAIGWYKKAMTEKYEQAYTDIGMLFMELGRVDDADRVFRERAGLGLGDLDSWLQMASNQFQENDLEAAMKSIRECMKYSEENPKVWYLLASILFKRGLTKKSAKAIENALRYDQDYPEALRLYGKILHEQGKRKEALKVFQRIIDLAPDDSMAWSNLGVAYTNLRENDKAVQAFQKAVDLDVDNRVAWQNLATLYRIEGRVLESKEADDRAKELEDFVNGD